MTVFAFFILSAIFNGLPVFAYMSGVLDEI